MKPEYEEKDVIVVPRQTLVLGFNKNRVKSNDYEDMYDSDTDYKNDYEDDYDDYEDALYPDQYAFYQSMAQDFPEDCDDD